MPQYLLFYTSLGLILLFETSILRGQTYPNNLSFDRQLDSAIQRKHAKIIFWGEVHFYQQNFYAYQYATERIDSSVILLEMPSYLNIGFMLYLEGKDSSVLYDLDSMSVLYPYATQIRFLKDILRIEDIRQRSLLLRKIVCIDVNNHNDLFINYNYRLLNLLKKYKGESAIDFKTLSKDEKLANIDTLILEYAGNDLVLQYLQQLRTEMANMNRYRTSLLFAHIANENLRDSLMKSNILNAMDDRKAQYFHCYLGYAHVRKDNNLARSRQKKIHRCSENLKDALYFMIRIQLLIGKKS